MNTDKSFKYASFQNKKIISFYWETCKRLILDLKLQQVTYIDNDALAKIMVMWNGLKGSDAGKLAIRVKPIVVVVTCQFGQRP